MMYPIYEYLISIRYSVYKYIHKCHVLIGLFLLYLVIILINKMAITCTIKGHTWGRTQ